MDEGDKKLLLELAREVIYAVLDKEEPFVQPYKKFSQHQGCFVTLYKNKELRGCIGFVEPLHPLYKQIAEAAKAAAFDDTRFAPVRKEELPKITIEISLLSKPQLLTVQDTEDYLKHIVIGRDGLILRGKYGSGLLLPQVAVDHNLTVQQFLNAAAQKAGLGFQAWQDLNNKLYTFQAEIIRES